MFLPTQLNVKTVLFQTIRFSVSTVSISKTVLFQVIQFSISTQFGSIWPIDKTLSRATTPVYIYVKNIKQTLVDNNFPNKLIDQQINQYLHNIHKNSNNNSNNNTNRINLYNMNQIHKNYKVDEQIITNIIHRHIKPNEPQKWIKLIIYYIKFKTSNLLVKNNTNSPPIP